MSVSNVLSWLVLFSSVSCILLIRTLLPSYLPTLLIRTFLPSYILILDNPLGLAYTSGSVDLVSLVFVSADRQVGFGSKRDSSQWFCSRRVLVSFWFPVAPNSPESGQIMEAYSLQHPLTNVTYGEVTKASYGLSTCTLMAFGPYMCGVVLLILVCPLFLLQEYCQCWKYCLRIPTRHLHGPL